MDMFEQYYEDVNYKEFHEIGAYRTGLEQFSMQLDKI